MKMNKINIFSDAPEEKVKKVKKEVVECEKNGNIIVERKKTSSLELPFDVKFYHCSDKGNFDFMIFVKNNDPAICINDCLKMIAMKLLRNSISANIDWP